MNEDQAAPRWIADLETMDLSERQQDGTYRPAYRMVPIGDPLVIDPEN